MPFPLTSRPDKDSSRKSPPFFALDDLTMTTSTFFLLGFRSATISDAGLLWVGLVWERDGGSQEEGIACRGSSVIVIVPIIHMSPDELAHSPCFDRSEPLPDPERRRSAI